MDFGLSEEQLLLEKSLRRFIEDEFPISVIREQVAKEPGRDDGSWSKLAELGVAGILVPEEYGGSGLGLLDAAVVAESLGWGATPAPFLGSAVMAALAITRAGDDAQRQRWLPGIATGDIRVGVAATELASRREGAGVRDDGEGLHGKALMVLDASEADLFLVPVWGDDGAGSIEGAGASTNISLALVEAGASGVERKTLRTIDRTRAFGELILDGAPVAGWLDAKGAAGDTCRHMLDAGRIILAADILGASERAIELAVAYAKERRQFERVIASFQAVKHMCAEMVTELEPARALVWYAAHAFSEAPDEAPLMACHTKAHLSEVGQEIVRCATEVHGGIGFTDEQNLHYWFKRVGVDRQLLGGPDALRDQAARLQGWVTG